MYVCAVEGKGSFLGKWGALFLPKGAEEAKVGPACGVGIH